MWVKGVAFPAQVSLRGTRNLSQKAVAMQSWAFPDKVRIVEVGPRDRLQAEAVMLPTKDKVELIKRLSHAGCAMIDAAAFVHPKWNPKLADGAQVFGFRPNGVMSGLMPRMAIACLEVGCHSGTMNP
eukprot:gene28082-19136_t